MRAYMFAALCLLAACDQADQPPQAVPLACRLDKLAELPMAPTRWVIVPASLNNHPVSMMLDTGAQRLTVLPRARLEVGLSTDHLHSTIVHGVGGTVTTSDVIIDQLQLGDFELPQSGASVADIPEPPTVQPPLAGIIGSQIMSHYDMEFDFRHHHVTLWQRIGCDAITPAWRGSWATARLQVGDGGLLIVPVSVNGQAIRALLDTGAVGTVIANEAAGRAGITAQNFSAARVTEFRGADASDVVARSTIFADVAVGGLHETDFRALIGPVRMQGADMMLGLDFLRRHNLWISYAGRVAFLQ